MADLMDQRARVAAVFDRAAETYDRVGVDMFQPIAARLVAELQPKVGERIVDMAAGAARRCCRWPQRSGRPDMRPGSIWPHGWSPPRRPRRRGGAGGAVGGGGGRCCAG